jgi:hypothetical protein
MARANHHLAWPCRLIIVGGSCSGKTYLVRKMILRRDLGVPKANLNIIVASPVEASLQQDIWKDLSVRGYSVTGWRLGKSGLPKIEPDKKKTLLIIDDVDHINEIRRGREWLLDLFGTESHHSDISVILIAHHLRIGCPAIRASADAVIICTLPEAQLKQTFKDLGLNAQEERLAEHALTDPDGMLPGAVPGEYAPLYNHVVVWRRPMFVLEGDRAVAAPTLFQLPRKVSQRSELTPLSPG